MEDSAWIQENYGTYRVLCFDTWSDGLIEAWTVSLMQEDIDYILEEIATGKRNVLTQDLLADYNSEHFDVGTPEYDALVDEVEAGMWENAEEWVEAQI